MREFLIFSIGLATLAACDGKKKDGVVRLDPIERRELSYANQLEVENLRSEIRKTKERQEAELRGPRTREVGVGVDFDTPLIEYYKNEAENERALKAKLSAQFQSLAKDYDDLRSRISFLDRGALEAEESRHHEEMRALAKKYSDEIKKLNRDLDDMTKIVSWAYVTGREYEHDRLKNEFKKLMAEIRAGN